jgi:hypothetical protein
LAHRGCADTIKKHCEQTVVTDWASANIHIEKIPPSKEGKKKYKDKKIKAVTFNIYC